jgi:hypothetical protein
MMHRARLLRTSTLARIPLILTIVWACNAVGTRDAGAEATAATPLEPSAELAQTPFQLALPTLASRAPISATSWSQLGGNPQRTAYAQADLPTISGRADQAWRVQWIWNGPAGGGDAGPAGDHLALPRANAPIVGNGRVYIAHSAFNDYGDDVDATGGSATLFGLDLQTGAPLWRTNVEGRVLNTGAYDPTTDSVFFGTTNGQLLKVNAADGAVIDSFNAGAAIRQAPLVVGDSVYIGTRGGRFFAVQTMTMQQRWAYEAGAALHASAAYSANYGGLLIFPSEDRFVHAVQAANGARRWRVAVNGGQDPQRGNVRFPDTHPVVAEASDAVIIRSYFNWPLTWTDPAGAPATVEGNRSFLTTNVAHQSFFVLELNDGSARFVAPVLAGAIGNNDDYYSTPPQAVVRTLPSGEEVAYLFWRTRVACKISSCDGREDTTFGEMNLRTGDIRFVRDWKNEGTMRFPTDEQGTLSMAGDVLFHSHWMSLGALRITDRSAGRGGSYTNPIDSVEYLSISNTVAAGTCGQRNTSTRFCPVGSRPPGDGYELDPSFYVYYANRNIYDQYYTPPVRSAIYSDGYILWKSVDGAVIALAPTRD